MINALNNFLENFDIFNLINKYNKFWYYKLMLLKSLISIRQR